MVSNEENASSLYHFSFKCESFQHYPLARARLKSNWSFWKTTGRARCGGPRDQINQGMGNRVSEGLCCHHHHLWIRFMAVSRRHLAAGRLKFVGYISILSHLVGCDGPSLLSSAWGGCTQQNPQIPRMERQLLPCPLLFPGVKQGH